MLIDIDVQEVLQALQDVEDGKIEMVTCDSCSKLISKENTNFCSSCDNHFCDNCIVSLNGDITCKSCTIKELQS